MRIDVWQIPRQCECACKSGNVQLEVSKFNDGDFYPNNGLVNAHSPRHNISTLGVELFQITTISDLDNAESILPIQMNLSLVGLKRVEYTKVRKRVNIILL